MYIYPRSWCEKCESTNANVITAAPVTMQIPCAKGHICVHLCNWLYLLNCNFSCVQQPSKIMQGVARRRSRPQCKVPCEFLQSTGRDFAINEYQKITSLSDDLDPPQQSTCINWKKKSWCGQGRSSTCSVTGVPGPPLLIFGSTIWPILDYNSKHFILLVFSFANW